MSATLNLSVDLRVIRNYALKGMERSDGRYPEIHQALATILFLVIDAQQSLEQAREPIDAQAHLDWLDEGTTAMDVDR